MKTIRLLESGNFLLGIDTSIIIDILTPRQLHEQSRDDIFLLAPESIFRRRKTKCSGTEQVIVRVSENSAHPLLLFDNDLGEFQDDTILKPPPLYPEKARYCCPEVMIHDDETVLCLEPDKLYELFDKDTTDDLLIRLHDLLETGKTAGKPKTKDERQELTADHSGKDKPKRRDKEKTTAEKENISSPVEATAESSEAAQDPVLTIISWIARKYDQRQPGENMAIRPEDVPAKMCKDASLDKEALRYLIKQTMTRLQKKRKQ